MNTSALWFRRGTSFAVTILVLSLAHLAIAAGRIDWKSKNLKEENGSWDIEVTMYMSSPPDVAMVPMRFSFEPKVYYERDLVDGKEGPQLRKVPLQYKQPLVESVDVGFLDPGNGKIQKRTKFSFKVTRAHGFEAGEYEVKVADARNDQSVGSPVRLVFDGENEVIDRRSMVFTGEKAKKKDEKKEGQDGGASAPAQEEKKQLTPEDDEFWQGGPKDEGPPPEKEKPGGCGCRVVQSGTDAGAAAGALLLIGLCVARRRKSDVSETNQSRN
jgi:MYXO-CTERM domain-containing protein